MEGRLWPNCNHFNEIFYDIFVHVHLSSMAAICHHSTNDTKNKFLDFV